MEQLNYSGYGHSYNFGFGYGNDSYGDGCGDGCGNGYGDGHRDGHGNGGDGYSNGGYSSGHDYCEGFGYDGHRNDYNNRTYWETILNKYQSHGQTTAFWKSDSDGCPTNGGTAIPLKLGELQKVGGPLAICRNGLHATTNPTRWIGERLWIVALNGEVQWSGDKCAALERTILAEVKITTIRE